MALHPIQYNFSNTVVSTSPLLEKWTRPALLEHLNKNHHQVFRGIVDYKGGVILNGNGTNIEITVYSKDVYSLLVSQGLSFGNQTIYFRPYTCAFLTLFNVPNEAHNNHILQLVKHMGCTIHDRIPELRISRLFDIEGGYESLNGIVEVQVNSPPDKPTKGRFYQWFNGRTIPYAYNEKWRGASKKTVQPTSTQNMTTMQTKAGPGFSGWAPPPPPPPPPHNLSPTPARIDVSRRTQDVSALSLTDNQTGENKTTSTTSIPSKTKNDNNSLSSTINKTPAAKTANRSNNNAGSLSAEFKRKVGAPPKVPLKPQKEDEHHTKKVWKNYAETPQSPPPLFLTDLVFSIHLPTTVLTTADVKRLLALGDESAVAKGKSHRQWLLTFPSTYLQDKTQLRFLQKLRLTTIDRKHVDFKSLPKLGGWTTADSVLWDKAGKYAIISFQLFPFNQDVTRQEVLEEIFTYHRLDIHKVNLLHFIPSQNPPDTQALICSAPYHIYAELKRSMQRLKKEIRYQGMDLSVIPVEPQPSQAPPYDKDTFLQLTSPINTHLMETQAVDPGHSLQLDDVDCPHVDMVVEKLEQLNNVEQPTSKASPESAVMQTINLMLNDDPSASASATLTSSAIVHSQEVILVEDMEISIEKPVANHIEHIPLPTNEEPMDIDIPLLIEKMHTLTQEDQNTLLLITPDETEHLANSIVLYDHHFAQIQESHQFFTSLEKEQKRRFLRNLWGQMKMEKGAEEKNVREGMEREYLRTEHPLQASILKSIQNKSLHPIEDGSSTQHSSISDRTLGAGSSTDPFPMTELENAPLPITEVSHHTTPQHIDNEENASYEHVMTERLQLTTAEPEENQKSPPSSTTGALNEAACPSNPTRDEITVNEESMSQEEIPTKKLQSNNAQAEEAPSATANTSISMNPLASTQTNHQEKEGEQTVENEQMVTEIVTTPSTITLDEPSNLSTTESTSVVITELTVHPLQVMHLELPSSAHSDLLHDTHITVPNSMSHTFEDDSAPANDDHSSHHDNNCGQPLLTASSTPTYDDALTMQVQGSDDTALMFDDDLLNTSGSEGHEADNSSILSDNDLTEIETSEYDSASGVLQIDHGGNDFRRMTKELESSDSSISAVCDSPKSPTTKGLRDVATTYYTQSDISTQQSQESQISEQSQSTFTSPSSHLKQAGGKRNKNCITSDEEQLVDPPAHKKSDADFSIFPTHHVSKVKVEKTKTKMQSIEFHESLIITEKDLLNCILFDHFNKSFFQEVIEARKPGTSLTKGQWNNVIALLLYRAFRDVRYLREWPETLRLPPQVREFWKRYHDKSITDTAEPQGFIRLLTFNYDKVTQMVKTYQNNTPNTKADLSITHHGTS
jgi:hypothetical protein